MVNTHTSTRKTDSPRGRILPWSKMATVSTGRRTRERLGAGRKISRGKNIEQAHAGEIASLKRAGKLTKRQYVEASIFYADKRRENTSKLTKSVFDREMYF